MYQIEIHYQTGDSFGSEERKEKIDFAWENFEVVKENLNRIKEHYEMYQETNRNYHMPFKEIQKKYGNKPWFFDATKERGVKTDPEFLCGYSLKLLKDDGTDFQYSTFWTGYFEHLYGADVVEEELPSFRI